MGTTDLGISEHQNRIGFSLHVIKYTEEKVPMYFKVGICICFPQDYASTLLLNGYETLEDLKDLKENHLIELNIENPEDRNRLLSAIENLQDCESKCYVFIQY